MSAAAASSPRRVVPAPSRLTTGSSNSSSQHLPDILLKSPRGQRCDNSTRGVMSRTPESSVAVSTILPSSSRPSATTSHRNSSAAIQVDDAPSSSKPHRAPLSLAALETLRRQLEVATGLSAASRHADSARQVRENESNEVCLFRDALRGHKVEALLPPSRRSHHGSPASETVEERSTNEGTSKVRHLPVLSVPAPWIPNGPRETTNLTIEAFHSKLHRWASATGSGAAEGLAQTLDELLTAALREESRKHHTSCADSDERIAAGDPELEVGAATASKGGAWAPTKPPAGAVPRRPVATTRHLPLQIQADAFVFSDKQDSTSLVQNHLLGTPHRVNFEAFVSMQQQLVNILFAGWDEICNQVRAQSSERAVILSTLRSAIGTLLYNAHDCATFYKQMHQDLADLRLDEKVKTFAAQLVEKDAETARLSERILALEAEVAEFEPIRREHDRLSAKQRATDVFLREQLQRNAAIMKMATQATGGVIPSHVVSAMLAGPGGLSSAAGSMRMPRRSIQRNRLSVVAGMTAATSLMQQHPFGSYQAAGGDGTVSPGRQSVVKMDSAHSTPAGTNLPAGADDGADGFASPPPFFVQATGVFDPVGGELLPDDGENPFAEDDGYECVDVGTQSTLDDVVDAKLMSECHAYYTEMDKASVYSQTVCKIVYGTTDFYNPAECCENARRLLEAISFDAQQSKDAGTTSSSPGGKSSDARLTSSGAAGNSKATTFATLMGHFDISKDKIVKLLQYGSSAAREMRMRFASLAENENFRKAIDWRNPKSAREACRLCNRLGPLPEDVAAIAENSELKEKIKTLVSDMDAAQVEIEKLIKRVEFERQISQTRADDLEALLRARRSMVTDATQTIAVTTHATDSQTEMNGNEWSLHQQDFSHRGSYHQHILGAGGALLSTGVPPWVGNDENSFSATPIIIHASSGTNSGEQGPLAVGDGGLTANSATGALPRSPFPTNESEWNAFRMSMDGAANAAAKSGSQFLSGPDSTFVTRNAVVSARRRSSIEVTFDPEAVASRESPSASTVAGRVLSAERRPTKTPQASDDSLPVSPGAPAGLGTGSATSVSPQDNNNDRSLRRSSVTSSTSGDFALSANRYRDAFLSMGRAATTIPLQRKVSPQSTGISPRDRVSPIDVEALLPQAQVRSHTWAIRMLGAVYRSRYSAGVTERSPGSPDSSYSCSRHFADFLRQNFGTKSLIEDNASSFLKTVHHFSASDKRFALFARLFCDEFHREVFKTFLTFSNCMDQVLPQFDSGPNGAAKKGDEQPEPSSVSLELILHCIYCLFYTNDRIVSREDFCHELAQKAVDLSTASTTGAASKSRRASLVAVKAFDKVGTPIESSDSFSKYRQAFRITIPSDAPHRVVVRVLFLTFLCEVARPYVIRSIGDTPVSPTGNSGGGSRSSSRPASAVTFEL